jgi:UDP-N-acetylmuramoylalanine--D-glutamate ligase
MKQLVVLGGGESGVGAALLGQQQGYRVLVSDKSLIKQAFKNVLIQHEIKWEEGGHNEAAVMDASLVVKSPGIPDTVPLVLALRVAGIKVIDEVEFASYYTKATLIGITGSNGKTTTTMLIHHILKSEGYAVKMGGNIGVSFAGLVYESLIKGAATVDYYVLELSSFQLDNIENFRPHIAVITNISPDHLDRYGYDMERYTAAKFRIAKNQTSANYLIYDADCPVIQTAMSQQQILSKKIPFSTQKQLTEGAFVDAENIKIVLDTNSYSMQINTLALEGTHNVKNTMAAAAAATLIQIRKETIRNSVQHFQGAPHRLEKVLKIQHVHYINDSKATNVNATYYALESVKTPIVWIVGGLDKGNDYMPLMSMVREKVKAIICLGVDNEALKSVFSKAADILIETTSMEEAVKVASKVSEKGDTVLLSPACASFDLFKNYEDRGNQFKEAVRSL